MVVLPMRAPHRRVMASSRGCVWAVKGPREVDSPVEEVRGREAVGEDVKRIVHGSRGVEQGQVDGHELTMDDVGTLNGKVIKAERGVGAKGRHEGTVIVVSTRPPVQGKGWVA